MMVNMLLLALSAPPTPQVVEEGGMTVSWVIDGDAIEVTLRAKTTGWLFVGFTEGSGLQGARWIATRVKNGEPEAHERVTDFGFGAPFHKARRDVDGKNHVTLVRGSEKGGVTEIVARLKLGESLAPGRERTMHFAFSASDDWDHHSRMRTSRRITL